MWLFIVAPLIGGALAAVVAPLVTPAVEKVVAAEGEAIPRDTTGAGVPHPDNRSRA